ncbi:hypothetical protein [Cupriavidus cauae]|nr:hypothetical protein [Cupriavidus cauae]
MLSPKMIRFILRVLLSTIGSDPVDVADFAVLRYRQYRPVVDIA